MRLLLVIILFGLTGLLKGQDTSFYYTIGTDGKDEPVYGVESADGFTVFGNTGEVGKGASDIYVIHLNLDFEIDSFIVIGTSANERLVDGAVDSLQRHVLLTSYYNGYSNSEYDIQIILLDSNFDVIDNKVLEEPATQIPVEIKITSNRVYILYKDYTTGEELSHKIVEFDYNFTQLMELNIIGYDSLSISSFLVGESIVVFGDYKPIDSNNLDYLILNYNMLGQKTFEKSFGFGRDEISARIISNNDTSFFITGSSNSSFSDDFDAFIGLLDYKDFSVIWRKSLGWNPNVANRDEHGVNPVTGVNGHIYFGLTSETYGEGVNDFHCYELMPNGDFVQGNSFGFAGDESLKKLYLLADSSFVFLGNTKLGGGGPSDIFIVRTKNISFGNEIINLIIRDSISSVSTITLLSEIDFKYSNDLILIQDESSIRILKDENDSYELNEFFIYNMQGMLVRYGSKPQFPIDINELTNGAYLFVIETSEELTITKKFVKF